VLPAGVRELFGFRAEIALDSGDFDGSPFRAMGMFNTAQASLSNEPRAGGNTPTPERPPKQSDDLEMGSGDDSLGRA